MDALVSFFIQRWPVFAIVLIAVILTVLFCKWYYGRFVPTERKADDGQQQLQKLPCQKHEAELSSIQGFLRARYPVAFEPYDQRKNPRSLNEEGERLFNDMGGAGFLETHGPRLLNRMAEQHPKTPLDVEYEAQDALFYFFKDDMFNELKRWVYYSPMRKMTIDGVEKDHEVTMEEVLFVLSLPLRDLYLELHPEIVDA